MFGSTRQVFVILSVSSGWVVTAVGPWDNESKRLSAKQASSEQSIHTVATTTTTTVALVLAVLCSGPTVSQALGSGSLLNEASAVTAAEG
jgi:hypothetical protein